jgi:hypothetical protein
MMRMKQPTNVCGGGGILGSEGGGGLNRMLRRRGRWPGKVRGGGGNLEQEEEATVTAAVLCGNEPRETTGGFRVCWPANSVTTCWLPMKLAENILAGP